MTKCKEMCTISRPAESMSERRARCIAYSPHETSSYEIEADFSCRDRIVYHPLGPRFVPSSEPPTQLAVLSAATDLAELP